MSASIDFYIFPIYNCAMKTKTNGRGRPPKGSAETKSESLLLRLDPGEKQGFADAARLAGVPLSVWIRERLRKIAARELSDAGQEVVFLNRK